MKFSCYKSDLNEALQFVIRAVAVKPDTPVLSGIYLRAEGSTLELQANNFSMGIITRIPINTEVAGEIVISGKLFQEFIRNMPDETISFSKEDNLLKIQSGGATVDLLTMSASDFPKVKTPETNNSFKIRATLLRDLIKRTIFAVAIDKDNRMIFKGCSFDIKGDQITLAATNTHRIAVAKAQLTESYSDSNFIAPADTLRGIMLRINPDDAENYVMINYSTRYLTFTFDNVFVTSRIIEGQFPPYDRIIPTSSTTRVIVNTAKFKRVVEFISIISQEVEYNTIKFVFADGGIDIFATSIKIGSANQNIEAEIEGDELDISFNVGYIADVLRIIESDKVVIALNDKYSPAAFTEPGKDDYVYVVTPVRA